MFCFVQDWMALYRKYVLKCTCHVFFLIQDLCDILSDIVKKIDSGFFFMEKLAMKKRIGPTAVITL